MDYEKKYNELVGKIKRAYLYAQTDSTKAVLEDILPELRESKDERVRKALIRFHKSSIDIDGIKGEDIISWLEKQGESFDEYEGLTDFERAVADICIGYIGKERGWKQYIKDNADILLKIAIKKFHSIQDALFEQKSADKDEPKEDNRPVTERIKTFKDACQELDTKAFSGDETAAFLLADYESNADNINNPQTLAYMRLAIIEYALNEGWEPKFEKGEYRYFPWFYFYNKEQYDELDVEEKERCVLRSGRSHANAYCGFVGVNAYNDASSSSSYSGSRLVFRTRELAAYAGRQFTEEWADFVFKTE